MGDVVDLRRVKCGWLSPAQARSINGDAGELARFVRGLPKAELHVHIEGTFEPETMLAIALRNGLEGKLAGYDGDAEAWCESQRSLRNFDDLQGFLDLYYAGCDVLRSEDDFYDLCMSYCRKAAAGGVRRAEIFFDPQTHTVERNALPLSVVINGLHRACVDAKSLGLDAALIMCFLRHRHPGCTWTSPPAPAEEPLSVLEEAIKHHRHQIIGVGLDSSEAGNPPSIFRGIFQRARAAGLRCVAHAGEEGPAGYITEALDLLGCERIDHGVRCLEEPTVVCRLAQERVPLTVCPCSNHRLQVVSRFFGGENPVRAMLNAGLVVTLNSDDPAYFFGHVDKFGGTHGGYLPANYVVTAHECGLSADEVVVLARNSLESSFASPKEKEVHIAALRAYVENFATTTI